MSKQGLSSHVLWAHPAGISINKEEAILTFINAKIEKDVKLTVDKLVISVVENNYSFSTAPKKPQNHSGAIDCSVDKGFLKKKKKRKEYKIALFLKWMPTHKLNPVSLLMTLHLTATLISHLSADEFKKIIHGASNQYCQLFKNRVNMKRSLGNYNKNLKKQSQKD